MGEGKEESILTTPFILLSDASTSKVLHLWRDYPPWVGQFLEIIKDLLLKMFKLQTNPFRAYTTFTFFIGLSHIRPLSACPNPSGQGTRQPRADLHLSSCWSDSSSPTQTHLSCLIPSSRPTLWWHGFPPAWEPWVTSYFAMVTVCWSVAAAAI